MMAVGNSIALQAARAQAEDARNASPAADTQPKAKAAAQEFEQVFLNEMLKEMFSGLGRDDPFSGHGQEIFREMLINEYADNIVDAGGIGLADAIYRELLSLQEIK